MRKNGREFNELRKINVYPDFIGCADGSCLIEMGNTRVICTASIVDSVPPFLQGTGQGWITAEYSMLPASTGKRTNREASRGKQSGRTLEIQRLIGRAMRSVCDLKLLGERTIWIDCDVIEADGGTRTASINGGFIALKKAINKLLKNGEIEEDPVKGMVGAVSLGITNGEILLDIDYDEDSSVDVDLNVVMDDRGNLIEIQGTGERATFSVEMLNQLLEIARDAIAKIHEIQKKYIS